MKSVIRTGKLVVMNQLLLGASFPFLAAAAYYLIRKCRASRTMLILTPVAMFLSMIWAIAPDLPRLFGYNALYLKLALDPRCNIFYWHYSIDLTETDSPLYSLGFTIMAACMLFALWREIRLAENA
jgi:hypothetical protein